MPTEATYDIFLSYRHGNRWREHSKQVELLRTFISELGVTTWLDTIQIPQNSFVHEAELRDTLEAAVRDSRLLLQFHYVDRMDHSSSGSKLLFNWPYFERQFAREVLTVLLREDGPSFLFSPTGGLHPFFNLRHLAYLLALTVDKAERAEAFWLTHLERHYLSTRDKALVYGLFPVHTVAEKSMWPDAINPDKPEFRRNMLPLVVTAAGQPEVVRGHSLLTWDGRHCPNCGKSVGVLRCPLVWLLRGRFTCHHCGDRLGYDRKRLDAVLACAVLAFVVVGLWGSSHLWLQWLVPAVRVMAAFLIGLISTLYICALLLRSFRRLVRMNNV